MVLEAEITSKKHDIAGALTNHLHLTFHIQVVGMLKGKRWIKKTKPNGETVEEKKQMLSSRGAHE